MAFYRQRQAVTAQEWLRGATPRLRSGAVAEVQPHVQGAAQEGGEELLHVEGQEGRLVQGEGRLVQGKEQP